jgi:hypothetical protein
MNSHHLLVLGCIAAIGCASPSGRPDSTVAVSSRTIDRSAEDIEWRFPADSSEVYRLARLISLSRHANQIDSNAIVVAHQLGPQPRGRYLLMTFSRPVDSLQNRRAVVLFVAEPGDDVLSNALQIGVDTLNGWTYEVASDLDGDGNVDVRYCDFRAPDGRVSKAMGHSKAGWYEWKGRHEPLQACVAIPAHRA